MKYIKITLFKSKTKRVYATPHRLQRNRFDLLRRAGKDGFPRLRTNRRAIPCGLRVLSQEPMRRRGVRLMEELCLHGREQHRQLRQIPGLGAIEERERDGSVFVQRQGGARLFERQNRHKAFGVQRSPS